MKKYLVIFILIASNVCFSYAAPTPEKTKAILEMLDARGIKKQLMTDSVDEMFAAMDQMMAMSGQSNAAESKALKKTFRDWIKEDVDQGAIIKGLVVLYDKHFTLSEIKDITAFFKTPAGKKMAKKELELSGEILQVVMTELESKHDKLMKRLEKHFQ